MGRERTVALTCMLAAAFAGCTTPRSMTDREINVRDTILENPSYHFTLEAQHMLRQDPLYLTLSTNGGGLAFNDEQGIWAECGQDTDHPQNRDEACLHEMSHLFNYNEQNSDPSTDTHIVVVFDYMAGNRPSGDYWHDLVQGDSQGWAGMDVVLPDIERRATEEFASGASKIMGQTDELPPELITIYEHEFNGNP